MRALPHGAANALPKKPEDWLEVASPPQKTRGIFKLFLGYAPGAKRCGGAAAAKT
jgi:hypothetical protein